MRYFISFLFFSITLYGFNYHLKAYKISEGIHCFFGLPSQISNVNGGNMINSCYVETSEGYLVIDSGPTYAYAKEAYGMMQKKKILPVKYVINTSWDEVHVLGNEFYKERGATLLGPKGYKEHIEKKEELFLETKLDKSVTANTRVVSLDNYITKAQVLKLGKMKIEIKTLEDDTNHLYVYIEDRKIVFAGDLVFNNRIVPINNGRSIIKWLNSLEELSALKWVDIISSHGYMTRRSALKNTKTYLTLLESEVLENIKKGKSKEETLKRVKLLSFSNDKFYDTWHPRNVARVYDELLAVVAENKQKKEVVEDTTPSKALEKENKISIKNGVKIAPTQNVKIKKKKEHVTQKSIRLHYRSYDEALTYANKNKKIIFVKIRSAVCKYCDQLDRVISRSRKVKALLSRYFEVVEINVDHQEVPMGLYIRSTPTLLFIDPKNEKVLMQLRGIRALGELIEILNEAVDDGHNGGYLRP